MGEQKGKPSEARKQMIAEHKAQEQQREEELAEKYGRELHKVEGKVSLVESQEYLWCPRYEKEILHAVFRDPETGKEVGRFPIPEPSKPAPEPLSKKLEILDLKDLEALRTYLQMKTSKPLVWNPTLKKFE